MTRDEAGFLAGLVKAEIAKDAWEVNGRALTVSVGLDDTGWLDTQKATGWYVRIDAAEGE